MVSSFSFSSIESWRGSFSEAKQLHDSHKGMVKESHYKTLQTSILFQKIYPPLMFSKIKEAFCLMCREQIQLNDRVIIYPCSHYLHEDCQNIWLQHKSDSKCLVCLASIQSFLELKTEKELIRFPYTLSDAHREKLLNALVRFIEILGTFDLKMQKSIPLVLNFIVYCFQKTALIKAQKEECIDHHLQEIATNLEQLIEKLPPSIWKEWINQLSHILVETPPFNDFFSCCGFKESIFFYLLGDTLSSFICHFFIRCYHSPSLHPLCEQILLQRKELLEIQSYTKNFKIIRGLNLFQLIFHLKTIQKEDYVILKKHAQGQGSVSKRIQIGIRCMDTVSKISTLFPYLILYSLIIFVLIRVIITLKTNVFELKMPPFKEPKSA